MNSKPIGVFDSGAGGLTVLKNLIKLMPNEDYIYLGDTAKVPYGNRSKNEIIEYSSDCSKFLKQKNVKMIVVACNTASTIAADSLEEICKDIEIIEIIRPASVVAVKKSNNGNIGIIATKATVKNKAYSKSIKLLEKMEDVNIYERACPELVDIVENNMLDDNKTPDAIKNCIDPLLNKNIDTLVLACTHFPFLESKIKKITGKINIVNPGVSAAERAYQLLLDTKKINESKSNGSVTFYLSKESNYFHKLATKMLRIQIDKPEIVSIHSE